MAQRIRAEHRRGRREDLRSTASMASRAADVAVGWRESLDDRTTDQVRPGLQDVLWQGRQGRDPSRVVLRKHVRDKERKQDPRKLMGGSGLEMGSVGCGG